MHDSGGGLKIVDSSGERTFLDMDEIFPVDTILCRADNISPASFLGGTWQKIAEGQTIIGASAEFPLNSMGGSETHTHALGTMDNASRSPAQALIQTNVIDGNACIAKIPGDITAAGYDGWYPTEKVTGTTWERGNYGHRTGTTPVVGNTQEHSSLQPYTAKNYWQRIA